MFAGVAVETSRLVLRISHGLSPRLQVLMFDDIILAIPKGVFNPIYTISPRLVLDVAVKATARGVLLDLGSGTGVLAIGLARLPGVDRVYAYDASPRAIAATVLNAKLNGVEEKVIVANDIDDLPQVDAVAANPPYLPLDPRDDEDRMWCGGRELEVVTSFVAEATRKLKPRGRLIISASSLSDGWRVADILSSRGFMWRVAAEAKMPWERIRVYLAILPPT